MKFAPRILAKLVPLVMCATLSGAAYAQNDTMSNVLQKLMSRIEKLQSSCTEDLKQYCSAVTPGGGRLVYCLESYEDKISAKCAFDLDEVELDLQDTTEHLKEAVRADWRRRSAYSLDRSSECRAYFSPMADIRPSNTPASSADLDWTSAFLPAG